jgi:hypothetical protein
MGGNRYQEGRSQQRRAVSNKQAPENPFGLGLVIVGAGALAIAAFLPFVQPADSFRMVEDNTLIQNGGWWLIVFAIAIPTQGYRVIRPELMRGRGWNRGRGFWSGNERWDRWKLIALCGFAAFLVLGKTIDTDPRRLYPVGPGGVVDTTQPGMVASFGIAIYVAWAGVATAFVGSLWLFQGAQSRALESRKVSSAAEATRNKWTDNGAGPVVVHESTDQGDTMAGASSGDATASSSDASPTGVAELAWSCDDAGDEPDTVPRASLSSSLRWFLAITALLVTAAAAMWFGTIFYREESPPVTAPSSLPAREPALSKPGELPKDENAGKTIRYEVTGASGAALNVTYMINEGEQQETKVKLPWSKEFTADQGFQTFVVNAQNAGPGSITCKILVDGKVMSEHTSNGQASVVMCMSL